MKYVLLSWCLLGTLLINGNIQAQSTPLEPGAVEKLEAVEDTLGMLAYAMVNDSIEENRFGAVRAFIPTLVQALKTPNSFQFPFEQLQMVSIQYPADSTFRIFTWQVYVDKDNYRYYGAIQMDQEELKLIPLRDRSFEVTEDLEQVVLSPDQWYGSLYYNIQTVGTGEQAYHLLFGFDGYEFFRKRKIVDVLRFVDGEPTFGAPVFIKASPDGRTSSKNRLVFEYSAAASMRCNYDPALDLLIFDHLTTMGGQYGEGPVNIPDGTYEAYELSNGRWEYVEKVFNTMLDTPPRPEPVLEGRKGKDLMGKDGGRG